MNAAFFSDTRRVDKNVAPPYAIHLDLNRNIDGIAGGSGNGTDNHSLRASQGIDDGRLSHVGAPDDRELERIKRERFVVPCSWLMPVGSHKLNGLIQQLFDSLAMNRRHRKKFFESEC